MYGKIVDGNAVVGLPRIGKLNDGRDVSNYNLLDQPTLLSEGWQVCQEVIPSYDTETEMLEVSTKEVVDGAVVITYVAVAKPVE